MDTKKLRQKILDLAIRGKLVPQDPNDEPASVLLGRIRAEKEQLIKEGKIKRSKKTSTCDKPPYENMPFEIPESWEWCRLDDIGEIITGTTPSKDIKEFYGGDIPFYKPKDLEGGIETNTALDKLSLYGYEQCRKLPSDSVLVTCIGATIGKTGVIKVAGACNQQINAIIPSVIIDCNYLYYTIISDFLQNKILYNSSSTTLPIINKGKFSELQFPLPPIEEQCEIVNELGKVFELIEYINKNIEELLSDIKQAKSKILDLAISGKLVPQNPDDEPAIELLKRINPTFVPCDNPHYEKLPFEIPESWCWARLGEITNYGKCENKNVTEINNNEWILELEDIEKDTGHILQVLKKEQRNINGIRHKFSKGDVLYSKLRTYLNKVLVAPGDGYCSSEIIPIRCFTIEPMYLNHVLRSDYYLDYTSSLGYGVKMPRLGTNDALISLIPIPPLNEQKRIVEAIDSLFKQLDIITAELL